MHRPDFFATIVLITYNSAEYVVETLESIRNQTFRDFELIISDDCSTDDTVTICREWLKTNGDSFKSAQIIASPVNTGIPANANRGILAARGQWIKIIAGDDLLTPQCLQLLHEKTLQSPAKVFVGKFVKFVSEDGKNRDTGIYPTPAELEFFQQSASGQLRWLLLDSFNFAPAAFISRDLFETIGYYDEQYRLLEDIPYWIRVTEKGHWFELIDGVVVWYRTNHASNVFAGDRFYNTAFMDCLFQFRRQEVYPRVPKTNLIFYQAEFQEKLNYQVITRLFGNKKNMMSVLVSKAILFPTLKRFLKPLLK